MSDDEDDWDEDFAETTCDHCGETRRCTLTDDPFAREIYPDDPNEDTWWCYRCFSNRAADI